MTGALTFTAIVDRNSALKGHGETTAELTCEASPHGKLLVLNEQEGLLENLSGEHRCFLVGRQPHKLVSRLKLPTTEAFDQIALAIVAETRALYGNRICESIAHYLIQHHMLSEEQHRTFHFLLQEGLSNAIEHGSLGLSSIRDRQTDRHTWLDNYYKRVEELLTHSTEGDKPISLFVLQQEDDLLVWIEDEGAGFDILNTQSMKSRQPHYGRGLSVAYNLADKAGHDKGGKRFFFQISSFSHSIGFAPPTRMTAKLEGRILVVDDQKINRDLACHFLKTAGYKNLETATNGVEALEKVISFEPNLILMDIMMPEMDGFETCQTLKANPATADIPVLFLSGLTDAKTRTQGYRLGAVDYVNKPIDRNEMIARTEVHILNGMMLSSMHAYSQRLVNDLDNARRFQISLLPSENNLDDLCTHYDVQIQSYFHPCDELAGDYWSAFPIDNQYLGFSMVDFTGHGVLAALNTIRLHAFFYELEALAADPLSFTEALNRRLYSMLNVEHFATLIYGVLNKDTGDITYAACGAPPPVILPQNTETPATYLPSAGVPLGLLPQSQFNPTIHTAHLNEGDTLLLYSDALVETLHEGDIMWEGAELLAQLEALRTAQPRHRNILTALRRQFNRTAQKPLLDDLTLLAISR